MDELQKRIKSFAYAFTGIGSFLRKEHNAWIHCIAIIIVTITGFIIGISRMEWVAVLLCFGLVLAAEAFNTAIERLENLCGYVFAEKQKVQLKRLRETRNRFEHGAIDNNPRAVESVINNAVEVIVDFLGKN